MTLNSRCRADCVEERGPVARGKVYLLDRDEKVGDTLRVLDFAGGKELWNFAYEAPGSFMFAGSRTTPTVDGTSSREFVMDLLITPPADF